MLYDNFNGSFDAITVLKIHVNKQKERKYIIYGLFENSTGPGIANLVMIMISIIYRGAEYTKLEAHIPSIYNNMDYSQLFCFN